MNAFKLSTKGHRIQGDFYVDTSFLNVYRSNNNKLVKNKEKNNHNFKEFYKE